MAISFFKYLSGISKIMKYSFCLAKLTNKFHELTEEEKYNYAIANYMFFIIIFFYVGGIFVHWT